MTPCSPKEVALDVLKVSDEGMASLVRSLHESRGYATEDHHLVCCGDAGRPHNCLMASVLGISRVIICPSSQPTACPEQTVAHEIQRLAAMTWAKDSEAVVSEQFGDLLSQATLELERQGFAHERISHECYINVCYVNSSSSIMVLKGSGWDFEPRVRRGSQAGLWLPLPREGCGCRRHPHPVDGLFWRQVANRTLRPDATPQRRRAHQDSRPATTNPVYVEGYGHLDRAFYGLHPLTGSRSPPSSSTRRRPSSLLPQGRLEDGDVLVSSHLSCGSTRLPDITVTRPVFNGSEIVPYVAWRGHHADSGGIRTGSMPPTSASFLQEGRRHRGYQANQRGPLQRG